MRIGEVHPKEERLIYHCLIPAHESNVGERNSEFQRISESLFVRRSPPPRLSACLSIEDVCWSACNVGNVTGSVRTALDNSDFVVWLGDLNYRIQDDRNRVDYLINQNRYMVCWLPSLFLSISSRVSVSSWKWCFDVCVCVYVFVLSTH